MKDQFAKWQPIDSAPKDGSQILAFDEGAIMIVSWFDEFDEHEDRQIVGWWDNGIMDPPPTHWMPLPDPPAEATPPHE